MSVLHFVASLDLSISGQESAAVAALEASSVGHRQSEVHGDSNRQHRHSTASITLRAVSLLLDKGLTVDTLLLPVVSSSVQSSCNESSVDTKAASIVIFHFISLTILLF